MQGMTLGMTLGMTFACLEGVWMMSGWCLEGVWKVSGGVWRCLKGAQKVFGMIGYQYVVLIL